MPDAFRRGVACDALMPAVEWCTGERGQSGVIGGDNTMLARMRCTGSAHSGSVVHSTVPLTRPGSLTFVRVTLLPSGRSELPGSELRGWWLVPTAGGEEPGGQVEVYGLEHSVLPAQGLLAAAVSW